MLREVPGQLGFGVFLSLFLSYGSFPFPDLFSPAAGNAGR